MSLLSRIGWRLLLALALFPARLPAATGGAGCGWRAWWVNLHHRSPLTVAFLTVLILPSLGLAVGTITELGLKRIGINLKSRVPTER